MGAPTLNGTELKLRIRSIRSVLEYAAPAEFGPRGISDVWYENRGSAFEKGYQIDQE